MKTIIIFGGTGFIGKHLIRELLNDNNIIVFSRNKEKAEEKLPENVSIVQLNLNDTVAVTHFFDESDVVINLSGENIGGGRWTESFRNSVAQSRKTIDDLIVAAFNKSVNKPSVVIQGSAIGIYGTQNTKQEITESSPVSSTGFLATTASGHESNLDILNNKTRLVYLRTGIVLDKKEGALPRMALPFKMFVGGKIGNGNQYLSWIHIKDQVKAIRFILENENISGPVNLSAPNPVTQAEFAKRLGKVLKRPSFIPAPAFALKLLLGKQWAEELLLTGLAVKPDKLLSAGYSFSYKYLDKALAHIYV